MKNTHRFVAILLFVSSLIIRCVGIDHDYVWDEGYWVSLAEGVMKNPAVPELPRNLIASPLFGYILAGWWSVFGESPFSSRLLVALMGSLTVVITYLAGSYLYGRRSGMTAALFLTFSPVHWTLSRMVMADIPLLLAFLSSLVFFFHGINKEKSQHILIGGILAGVAVLMKFSGLVLVGVFSLYALTLVLQKRRINVLAVIVSIAVPLATAIIWLLYLGSRLSSYVHMVFGGVFQPVYVSFVNIVLHMLVTILPLLSIIFFDLKKSTVDRWRRVRYIGFGILLLLLVLIEILIVGGGRELFVQGVLVKAVISGLGPSLGSFVKVGMIVGGIIAVLGLFWVYDDGSYHGIFLMSILVPSLILVSAMDRKYPRYLLNLTPLFFLASSVSMWRILEDRKLEKVAFVYVLICVACFFSVGYISLMRLIGGSTPV